MSKRKTKSEELVKGDKLRDLILLVHLNNKYGKGKNEIPALKEILDYSTGGIYSALDNSGYFERTTDGIQLTEKGKKYLSEKILPQYSLLNSVGNVFIVIGAVFILQWLEWTYWQHAFILNWYAGLSLLVGGLVLRFLGLRLHYWVIRKKKKMTNL